MDTNKPDDNPIDIIASNPRSNKKLYLVIAGVLVLLAAVAGYFLLAKKSPLTDLGIGKPAIMLGQHRYVDACQLLPPDKAGEAFGQLTAGSTVEQTFFDKSVEKVESTKESSECSYLYKGDQPSITVETSYYPDDKKAQEDWYYPLKVSSGEYRKEMFAKPDLPPADPNDPLSGQLDSSGFEAIIEQGVKRAEEEDGGRRIAELGDDEIVFVPYRQTYQKRFGNTLVSLRYSTGFEKNLAGLPVEQVKKAFATINTNASNKNLAQDPLGATPFGVNDPAGKTKVFAPCDVLTAVAFKDATGIASTAKVAQTTIESGSHDAENYYVTNDCKRTGGDREKEGIHDAVLTLTYAKNPEISKKIYDSTVAAYKARKYEIRDLKTTTDAAVMIDEGDTEGFGLVYGYARLGNYNVKVELEKRKGTESAPLSDDAHVKLINAVANYIK